MSEVACSTEIDEHESALSWWTTSSLSCPVLVGRDAELGTLVAAATRPPSLVLIQGEPGIGKSRVALELLQRPEMSHVRKLVGRCHPLRDPFPLGPVVDVMRGLADLPDMTLSPVTSVLRPLIPELDDLLPREAPRLSDPRAERHLVFRALRELLTGLGPCACFLDDLHWADESSGDFIRFLAAKMPEQLTLILTYRPGELPPSSAMHGLAARADPAANTTLLELEPLTVDGVRQMAALVLDVTDVPQDVARHLHARTAGIPFAVEELVRQMRARPEVLRRASREQRNGGALTEVPPTVRDSVLEGIVRLPRIPGRVAEAVAVLDVPVLPELVASVVDLPLTIVREALRHALRKALLVESPDGRVGFRHSLATQAVYEAIPRTERIELHLRAATALEDQEPPPANQLAHHYERADRPDEWARWAEAAADHAVSVGDPGTALRLLRRAVVSAEMDTSVRGRLAIKLGWAAVSVMAVGGGIPELLQEVIDRDGQPIEVVGEIRCLLASLLRLGGQACAASRAYERAVGELTSRPELAARTMLQLASPWRLDGTASEHLSWLDRAERLASRSADPATNLAVRASRATTLVYLGGPRGWAAADTLPDVADTPEMRRELLWASLDLALGSHMLGFDRRAEQFLDLAIDHIGLTGCDESMDDVDSIRLLLRWSRGEWTGLEERATRHTEISAGVPRHVVSGLLVAGLIALEHGDHAAAGTRLRHGHEMAASAGLIFAMAMAAAGLGRIRLREGRPEEACREVSGALQLIERKGAWTWAASLAPTGVEALAAAGRLMDARALVEQFRRGVKRSDAPACAAAVDMSAGHLARALEERGEAEHLFLRAHGVFVGAQRPFEAARAMLLAGSSLLHERKRAAAGPLAQAAADFDGLGAVAELEHAQLLMARVRGLTGRPVGRPAYGNRLSPRELEVARLAAHGRTNAEIAGELFLSPKTVERHLTSAMQKLGVRSRTVLAASWPTLSTNLPD